MSLKAFHIIFIIVATAALVAFGLWAVGMPDGDQLTRVLGISSFVGALGMLIYGRWFLKKLKDVSYL